MFCQLPRQDSRTPGIWNPLPSFDTVRQDHQLSNIRDTSAFYTAVRKGRLPAVSWVIPSGDVSEHPTSSIRAGQAYVTSLINAIGRSRDWKSTAIFLAWDDWGGFYDHVAPADGRSERLRLPRAGNRDRPVRRRHYIDHQQLSFDAFAKFIEDDFLGGQRLNPKTDGRPDPRPDVRENAPASATSGATSTSTRAPRPAADPPDPPQTRLTMSIEPTTEQLAASPPPRTAVRW